MHAHLMVLFRSAVDRLSKSFALTGVTPNCSANDLTDTSLRGRFPQTSVDRGMFYVWADKVGAARDSDGRICVDGNYGPCWEDVF